MATSGDEGYPYKKRFHTEINEEPQNVPQEAGENNLNGVAELSSHQGGNSGSVVATNVISELEQIMKQNTFTRYETQHLIALLHSRTIEESPSGAAISSSRVSDSTTQALRQDLKLVNNNATCLPKAPMASPQCPTTMENLPDELLSNIFIRLFSKQLAQMRSVSKSWNALLSDSSFVKSHLHHSIQYKDQILLHFSDVYSSNGSYKHLKALHCPSPHLQGELTNFPKLPPPTRGSQRQTSTLIGCVNGLICYSYDDSDIQIWNPSLSAVLTLPPYSIPSHGDKSTTIYFRFGYDPKTDDYKVVKLTGFIGSPHNVVRWWLAVEVYSMRKGSWEVITQGFPSNVTGNLPYDVVCVDGHDGHLHWLGDFTDSRISIEVIVAFDLGSDTFQVIPLPHFPTHRHDISLGVLARKLCVMSWTDDICELWVMEKYKGAKSWVKCHVFSPFSDDAYPFGFTSRNDFLFQDPYGRLVMYPVKKPAKILENNSWTEKYDTAKIVEYVDSLVWVAPAKPERIK